MNLAQLLAVYQEDKRVRTITEQLTPPSHLHLTGLVGASPSFIGTAIFQRAPQNHLFILPDKEAAAYFQNDLKNLLSDQDPLLFPDSFKRTGQLEEINNNQVQLRTETLNRFAGKQRQKQLLVTYPEAIFEKVVNAKTLNEHALEFKTAEALDLDDVIEFLVDIGFERVDFVYEPGEFSIRGGIIDIFSFGSDKPYRIELFGDEVDSIRLFDPVTQLSEKKLSRLSIIPNIQTEFSTEEKASLLEFLKDNTVVWVKDLQFTFERLEQLFEKALEVYEALPRNEAGELDQNHWFNGKPQALFESPEHCLQHLLDMPVIEFGTKAYFDDAHRIEFDIQPQPSFNRNFGLLIKDLQEKQQNDYQNCIFCANPRQIERFYHIFDDLQANLTFFPLNLSLSEGFIDRDHQLTCYTDHQIFNRFYKYQIKQGYSRSKAQLMKALKELKPGDYVTHIDHGVGTYSGLEKIEVGGQIQEAVRIVYKDNDLLYVNINSLHKISKYVGKEGATPKINKLGSDAWEQLKRRTKKKVKDIAKDLIKLYAKRKGTPGFAFHPDTYLQDELEASFIYEDTPDQEKTTQAVKVDMEKPFPMDRLVCGDVGFGKTEIAIRAAFKAVADSKQVAVLVPTTILAMQHYRTFSERLKDMPCRVDYINRFRSRKDVTQITKDLKEGRIDILIGTHAILGKRIEWKDIGLLVIDEEQKFGVAAKEKVRQIRANVDTLTLTATPIPRTLQFSMMGARDLSIIQTAPPNRQPIVTEVHGFDDELFKEAIYYEISRGGQVFLIHNRVKNITDIAAMVKRICPDLAIGIAHGQMDGKKLEDVMRSFIDHEFDVLVCTSIVESGLDIPNVNTIIINNAHQFGLSDLHQLRGRVGRSNRKAFCYLISPPPSTLSRDSRRRLQTIEEFSELGSGFNIAMRDMDIRGAGNLLGGEQSGFIAEIGFDMYHKILDEAMQELKESDFKDIFEEENEQKKQYIRDCQIDIDLEVHLPDSYVANINERLSLYTYLDHIEEEGALQKFQSELIDRFGPMPKQVSGLFEVIRLRWQAKDLGFERIIIKDKVMKCYFISNKESGFWESNIFTAILSYIQHAPALCSMKETAKFLILTFNDVNSLEEARERLGILLNAVEKDVMAEE